MKNKTDGKNRWMNTEMEAERASSSKFPPAPPVYSDPHLPRPTSRPPPPPFPSRIKLPTPRQSQLDFELSSIQQQLTKTEVQDMSESTRLGEMEAERASSSNIPPAPPVYSDPPPPPPTLRSPPPPPLPPRMKLPTATSPRQLQLDYELRSIKQQLKTDVQDMSESTGVDGEEVPMPGTSDSDSEIEDNSEIEDDSEIDDYEELYTNSNLHSSDWQSRFRSFYLDHDLDLDLDFGDDTFADIDDDDDALLNILFSGETKPTYPCGEELVAECLICFETVTLHRRLCCFFPVCDNCMQMYLINEVKQAVVEIKCISGVCDSYVHRDEILGRLPAEMKEKYYKFLVDANKDPSVKTCPRCSHIYQAVSVPIENNHGKYGLLVHCGKCELDWCFSCHAPWHVDVKCRNFLKGDQLLRTWAKEQHYGHPNAQKCPRCKIFIERKGGCDHMVCSKCNASFCYRCGERYWKLKFFGSHSSRFSLFGCKYNYKPKNSVLRKAVRGSVFGAKLVGGTIVLGLGVAAVAALIGASVIILPVYGGCKFYNYCAMKKRIKRQEQLFKLRTQTAMMEDLRERAVLERLADKQTHSGDTVHIGIQTSQSQQVDVSVHNPYQENVSSSEQTEIRMNIKDEKGQVTLTTAEITPGNNPDEAEIVLHVRTSYSRSTSYASAVTNFVGDGVLESFGYENGSSSESKSEYESQRGSISASTPYGTLSSSWKSKKKILRSKSVDNASFSKKLSKKVESGSLSKSNKKCLVIKNDETSFTQPPDLGVSGSLPSSPAVAEPTDTDENHQTAPLSQSGCFLKLFSKKLNTLQSQMESENLHGPKFNLKDNEIQEHPDIVHCAIEAELKKQNKEWEETDVSEMPELELPCDIVSGLVSTESCQTHL